VNLALSSPPKSICLFHISVFSFDLSKGISALSLNLGNDSWMFFSAAAKHIPITWSKRAQAAAQLFRRQPHRYD